MTQLDMADAINIDFTRWRECADASLQAELAAMEHDEAARESAFFRSLAFGTGGLRGLVGAGPNRLNVHTVAQATQGLADYLNERFDEPRVAIARDSRRGGEEFVCVVGCVLAANGIHSIAYPRVEPTPALSWAVRDQGCSAGICITASHNPAEYNGYKVYGADGCQITTAAARDIQATIEATDIFDDVRMLSLEEAQEQGWFTWAGKDVLDRFIDAVSDLSFNDGALDLSDLKVAFTPLCGAGLECCSRILQRAGVGCVEAVREQAQPNGDFPTCPRPNPELPEALELGLRDMRASGSDLLLATDPDCDRVGVAVMHESEPVLLSGNEVGMLLLDYLCSRLEERGVSLSEKVVVTTTVSAPMADAMACDLGFELRRTLTGFKFVGEQIGLLESAGQADRFLFGFEESCGYLSGTHVRDKDAVNAVMLICEAAGWHHVAGRDLIDALHDLCERYGYYKEALVSIDYPGAQGSSTMEQIMADLRERPPREIAGLVVERVLDYSSGVPMPVVNACGREDCAAVSDAAVQFLPPANVLEFSLEGGSKLIVRPSGTEPKVKAYCMACARSATDSESQVAVLAQAAREILGVR